MRARLLTLLAIIGPGPIVTVGDNDAGGVSTYARAGQNYGYTLLWTLPLLIPVLVVLFIGLMVCTLFTSVNVIALLEWLAGFDAVGLIVGLPIGLRKMAPPPTFDINRRDWRTPRLTLLTPLPSSRARRYLMRGQSAYLLVAGSLLVVRIIQRSTS